MIGDFMSGLNGYVDPQVNPITEENDYRRRPHDSTENGMFGNYYGNNNYSGDNYYSGSNNYSGYNNGYQGQNTFDADKNAYAQTVFNNASEDLKAADTNGDGKVTKQEFASVFGKGADDVKKMENVASIIDLSADGEIQAGELSSYFAALDLENGNFDDNVSKESINKAKKEINTNSDEANTIAQDRLTALKNWFGFANLSSSSEGSESTTDNGIIDDKTVTTKGIFITNEKPAEVSNNSKKLTSKERFEADKATYLVMKAAIDSNDKDYAKSLISELASKNPEKLARLELSYGNEKNDPTALRKWARNNNDTLIDGMNKAAKTNPKNAAIAVRDATAGRLGTDGNTVKTLISDEVSDDFILNLNEEYKNNGWNLKNDIKTDFSGEAEDKLIGRVNRALVNKHIN